MSIVNPIDKVMLVVARIFLGLVFIQNVVAVWIPWTNPYLDFRGFPHIGAPLVEIGICLLCLWNLHLLIARLILAFGAVLGLFINLLAVFVFFSLSVAGHKHPSTVIQSGLVAILFMEGLILVGLISILWVSLRPPRAGRMIGADLPDSYACN